MSELLDRALVQVRALPSEAQDEAAQLLLDWASDLAPTVDDRPPERVDRDIATRSRKAWPMSAPDGSLRPTKSKPHSLVSHPPVKVGFSEHALRDIEDIASYLQARNPRAAERVGAAIRRTIDRLETYPESGRQQDDPDGSRKLVVPGFGYLIYYRIESDAELMILTILHPARDRPYTDR